MDESAISMVEEQRTLEKKHSKIYKQMADEHKQERLSSAIRHRAYQLQVLQKRGRVNLFMMVDVEQRTAEYMEGCSRAGSFPTAMGLAVCFGYSLRSLNTWCDQHQDTDTAQYIERVKDVFADILTDKSLTGEANAIMSIFQLKNHYGHRDQVDIAPITQTQQRQSREELAQKYLSDADGCIPD